MRAARIQRIPQLHGGVGRIGRARYSITWSQSAPMISPCWSAMNPKSASKPVRTLFPHVY